MRKPIPFAILLILFSCVGQDRKMKSGTGMDVWYGLEQKFGNIGNTQRQINILGNIQTDRARIVAYYTLNDEDRKHILTLGSDLHRLAKKGDFNIEIEREELNEGFNQVQLYVTRGNTLVAHQNISINYTSDRKWPLPYHVKWSEVKNIQDVVEVVDGEWELTEDGIRTKFRYYDRVLAFGDSSWENYEVESSVIFHGYTPPVKGPPTYHVSHVAIASRWPGHDKDDLQPNRKWFPLGATSEFRITDQYDSCRWRIFDGEHFYEEQAVDRYREILPETKYRIKHRVEDQPDHTTLYSVKYWKAVEEEPDEWDFQAIEPKGPAESGSTLLIAHNTDVTFGNISVIPIF